MPESPWPITYKEIVRNEEEEEEQKLRKKN